MEAELDELFQASFDALGARLKDLDQKPWAFYCSKKHLFSQGLYLVYDGHGILLWVGRTRNLRQRLAAHLSPHGSSVMHHLFGDRLRFLGEWCACGDFPSCHHARERLPDLRHEVVRMRRRMRSTYRVAFLPLDDPDFSRWAKYLEPMIQWVLQPKWGVELMVSEMEAMLPDDRYRLENGIRIAK